jgi:hypothetical protein
LKSSSSNPRGIFLNKGGIKLFIFKGQPAVGGISRKMLKLSPFLFLILICSFYAKIAKNSR